MTNSEPTREELKREGYVLVPREPTENMITEGAAYLALEAMTDQRKSPIGKAKGVYAAMLDAAREVP